MAKNIDLRELFQLPVRQIVPSNNEELEAKVAEENQKTDCPMLYQAVKLRKHLGPRFQEHGDAFGLDYADGFELIEPETEMPDSLLKELQYDEAVPDKCELLIVVAMYNEGVEHFQNTMCGIANNLKTFVRYGVHPKRIGCALIIDGVKPFFSTIRGPQNEFTRTFFNQFYSEQQILDRFGVTDPLQCRLKDEEDHDEFAHLFMQNIVMDDDHMFPLQFFFTIKQKNRRKLNTHLWFFGGFCEFVQPQYVMLIDVGTKPLKNSLFYMYEAMKVENTLAGCCGEIKPMSPNMWRLVVPAQEVEYKFSHIFDKAFESVIGYITVLPGAFSAYKWEALQGVPLWTDYFKSICHPEEMGPFMSNIYLAEDRVLCLSLVSKKNACYTLRYVKASQAETDVPESIAELMSQRRRWINGSWFALVDSLKNFSKIKQSSHSRYRKAAFYFQMCYYYASVIFSWFMVGMFFVVFAVTITTTMGGTLTDVGTYLVLIYVALLLIIFILALAVKPKRVNDTYKGVAVIFGVFLLVVFFLTFLFVFKDIGQADSKDWARWAMLATFLMFIANMLVNNCVTVIARGLFHFLFMIPTYVNVFLIYSICNTHDCSWGNRPDVMTAEELARVEEFEEFRGRWTIIWTLCNAGFGFTVYTIDSNSESSWFVYLVAVVGLVLLSLRTFGGFMYAAQERWCKKHLTKNKSTDLYKSTETNMSKSHTLNFGPKRQDTAVVTPLPTDRATAFRSPIAESDMFSQSEIPSSMESSQSEASSSDKFSASNDKILGGDSFEQSLRQALNSSSYSRHSDSESHSLRSVTGGTSQSDLNRSSYSHSNSSSHSNSRSHSNSSSHSNSRSHSSRSEHSSRSGNSRSGDSFSQSGSSREDSALSSRDNSESRSDNSGTNYPELLQDLKEALNMSTSQIAEEHGLDSERLHQIEAGECEPDDDETSKLDTLREQVFA